MKSVSPVRGYDLKRRTPQGVRGLKWISARLANQICTSHPARGAWIEIRDRYDSAIYKKVAPRKGCVD